jgi:hypothetical protein
VPSQAASKGCWEDVCSTGAASTAQLARRLTRTAGWARAQLVVMLADGSNGSVEDNTQLKAVTDSFQIR